MHEAPAPAEKQVYQTIDWKSGSVRVIPTAIPDVAVQPRCIVERIGEIELRDPTGARSGPQEVTIETIYRVTAMGYGTNSSTAVNLQTMFRRQ